MTPVTPRALSNPCAIFTASWPVIPSATKRISVGMQRLLEAAQLVHHLFVDLQTSGGVDDHHTIPIALRLLDAGLRDLYHVLRGSISVNRNLELLAERLELIDCGGTIDVGGDEPCRSPFALQLSRELRGGGRLSGTLQTHHHRHAGLHGSDTSLLADGRTRVLGYSKEVGKGGVAYVALGHCHNPAIHATRNRDASDRTPPRFHGPWETRCVPDAVAQCDCVGGRQVGRSTLAVAAPLLRPSGGWGAAALLSAGLRVDRSVSRSRRSRPPSSIPAPPRGSEVRRR